ncbi:uncharacterized protein RSE6_14768 [Rhynchosporium secalis]|uniref:Uncharacterized protein n=1 Tax=Rhynchosporium secalis TaxID=38038 RepID=A0A1E1MWP5_RHYSE|nr:uncharacterized protein RSE6_14768 [Rhynchosporium secalis]
MVYFVAMARCDVRGYENGMPSLERPYQINADGQVGPLLPQGPGRSLLRDLCRCLEKSAASLGGKTWKAADEVLIELVPGASSRIRLWLSFEGEK